MSIYKVDLTYFVKDLIRSFLSDNKIPLEVQKVTDAYVNQTYFVKSLESYFYVKLMVRKPLDNIEHNRFLKTKYLSEKLLDETSVPMVQVLEVRIDPVILKNPPITIFSSMIIKQLPGTSLDIEWNNMGVNDKLAIAKQFSNYLKQINERTVDQFGDGIGSTASLLNQTWAEFLLDKTKINILKLNSRTHFTLSSNLLARAWNFINSKRELWDYQGSPKLIHKDLWAGNILVEKKEHWKITGFLDWEWSMGGDPLMDLLWVEDTIFSGDSSSISKFYKIMEINPKDPELILKKRVYDIIECISTCAVGYHFHNPTKEGFKRMEEIIIKQIGE